MLTQDSPRGNQALKERRSACSGYRCDGLSAAQARCLGLPVRSMDWALDALWSGAIPESPAGPSLVPHPAPAPRGAPPCPHAPEQPQDMAHAGAKALAGDQAQAAEGPKETIHELIGDSQSLGGACDASPSSPGIDSARPLPGPGTVYNIPFALRRMPATVPTVAYTCCKAYEQHRQPPQ